MKLSPPKLDHDDLGYRYVGMIMCGMSAIFAIVVFYRVAAIMTGRG